MCLYSWVQTKGVVTSPIHNLENAFSFASLPNAEYSKGTFEGKALGNQWRLAGFAKGMRMLLFRLHVLWNSSTACSRDMMGMHGHGWR